MRVCAVLQGGGSPPAGVDETVSAATLAGGVREALATGADWLWLLDPRTTPEPSALSELEALLADPQGLPAPLVLVSKVVGDDGEPDRAALPYPEMFEKDVTVAACARGLLQIRAARPGAVLVARRAAERFGPPRDDLHPPFDVVEWTARMLRSWDDVGFLVTASVARRAPGPAVSPPLRDRAVATLRGPGWTPTEKLWNAYLLGLGLATKGEPELAPRA